MAFAVLCSCPAPPQHLEFLFPSDQGGEASRMQRLEAAFHGARLQNRPGPHRPGNALELAHPKVIELEEAAEKPSCAFGDDDHVRLGEALQARRKVRRLADHAALFRLTRWDQVAYHDQAGCNAYADLLGSIRLETSDRRDQLKRSLYRSLGIVLMRVRIAKVHKDTVPHISCDEAAKAAHGAGHAFLIGRNDLAQVLRIHAGGERRRTDQVREHHSHLAPLGFVPWGQFGPRDKLGGARTPLRQARQSRGAISGDRQEARPQVPP